MWPEAATAPASTCLPMSGAKTTASPPYTRIAKPDLQRHCADRHQVLWDGQSTRKEVERLGHARPPATSNSGLIGKTPALEATRAYLDVQRYRKLVQLVEDNYVQHKPAHNQLQSKFKAGVGRGVDSEQANARLALADSNLTTEVANLHDVSARYLRIVGEALPPICLRQPNWTRHPGPRAQTPQPKPWLATPTSALQLKTQAPYAPRRKNATAPSSPKCWLACASGVGKNFDGVPNEKRDTTAELVLNWNPVQRRLRPRPHPPVCGSGQPGRRPTRQSLS